MRMAPVCVMSQSCAAPGIVLRMTQRAVFELPPSCS
jgi:hypothetical protein